MSIKFISPLCSEIYTRKFIYYKNNRLKTINLIQLIDVFLNRYNCFNRDHIKLNSRVLKYVYGGLYSKYLEYLLDHQFIYLYKNYSAGYKSKTYRLTDLAKIDCCLTTMINIPIKLDNKLHEMDHFFNDYDSDIKNKLIRDLYTIKIDLDKAQNWIEHNLPKNDNCYAINMINCRKIASNDLYYSFDRYGRFHTNFTVLKKEIRSQFLSIDNQPIQELDITNSQPFFLYLLMQQEGFNNFQGFDQDVLNGLIYDKIVNIAQISRKEAKVKVYSVLFGRNTISTYWNQLFSNVYPAVFEWIKQYKIKYKSYKIIAQQLQSIESDFMFKQLIPNILNYKYELPIITIHDSIMIPQEHYENVKIIFVQSLQKLIK